MRRAQPWKTNRARVLRNAETSAEGKLWSEVRNRQIAGMKFVRQAPIGSYYADFVCRELKIIIEVDGDTHGSDEELAYDRQREQELLNMGYRIYRAWNTEVYENMEGVIEGLMLFAGKLDELSAPTDFDVPVAGTSVAREAGVAAPHPHPLPVARSACGERVRVRGGGP